MPRACTVCTHDHRVAIDKALVDGASFRHIASRFGVSTGTLQRHKNAHLARILAESGDSPGVPAQAAQVAHYAAQRDAADRVHAQDLMGQLSRQVERLNDLSDAVDAWLRDPDDPSRYEIGPRSHEVTVVYEDYEDRTPQGNPRRKKASLAELIVRVEQASIRVDRAEIRYADPRELLLKTADAVKGQMQLLMGVLDRLHSASEVEAFQETVLTAIGEAAPDVRRAIDERLRQRHAPGRPSGATQR